jgi:hypothetical protein
VLMMQCVLSKKRCKEIVPPKVLALKKLQNNSAHELPFNYAERIVCLFICEVCFVNTAAPSMNLSLLWKKEVWGHVLFYWQMGEFLSASQFFLSYVYIKYVWYSLPVKSPQKYARRFEDNLIYADKIREFQ